MKGLHCSFLFWLLFLLISSQTLSASTGKITIGFNLPLTGSFEQAGEHAKNAAELVRMELDKTKGLTVGNKKYEVEFIYGDNRSDPAAASGLAVKQVSGQKVLGIIGPLSSHQAVPAGQMTNAFSTPMIAAWSTSPLTTKDRPFVFRSGSVLTVHGPVITKFAAKEFKATKAAVLFDIVSAYPRAMAKSFKAAFEKENGTGSVVAFESFRTGEKDFKAQLKRIMATDAQFVFSPQHYNEVPLIVKQAKKLGLKIPIMGSSSWAGGDLAEGCGDDCHGLFFTGDYAPGGAEGINKEFVSAYSAAYGSNPDEPAALTYDALRALLQSIQNTGQLSGNLLNDRKAVKDSLVSLKNFDGVTGMMSFDKTGDPDKCVIIVRIDEGMFTAYDSVCP